MWGNIAGTAFYVRESGRDGGGCVWHAGVSGGREREEGVNLNTSERLSDSSGLLISLRN